MIQENLNEKPVSPFFQIILIISNFILLIVFSYFFHKNFNSLDYFPESNSFDFKESDETTLLNLKIKEIVDSEISRGKITFDLSFSLILNADYDIEILTEKITFTNGKILKKLLNKKKLSDGKFYYGFNYVIELKNKFDYSMYPFDDHVALIKIKIDKEFFKKIFNPKIEITKENDFSGWKLYDSKIKSSTSKDQKFQKIKLFFALNKEGYKITLSILFPLCILFMINILSMSINTIEGRKLIITSLLGLNSFRIVLENSSPKTTYLLAIDIFYIVFLFISLMILFLHILEIEMKRKLSYLIVFLSHFSIIATFLYYLRPWIFS